jgi:hypothetical protein
MEKFQKKLLVNNTALINQAINAGLTLISEKYELDLSELLQTFEEGVDQNAPTVRRVKGASKTNKTTGYQLFCHSIKDEVKQEIEANMEEGENMSTRMGEMSKINGKKWWDLTDEERGDWNTQAASQNEENKFAAPSKKSSKTKSSKKSSQKSKKSDTKPQKSAKKPKKPKADDD